MRNSVPFMHVFFSHFNIPKWKNVGKVEKIYCKKNGACDAIRTHDRFFTRESAVCEQSEQPAGLLWKADTADHMQMRAVRVGTQGS